MKVDKVDNDEFINLLDLSREHLKNIEKELLNIQEILGESNNIECIDILNLRQGLLMVDNNLKSKVSISNTVKFINKYIVGWTCNKVEEILKDNGLHHIGRIKVMGNKLTFTVYLRPNEEIDYFIINLNNYKVEYTKSIEVIKIIDNHLDYLSNTIFNWRTTNAELRKLKKVLFNQRKLNNFLAKTDICDLVNEIGVSKYSLVNKYYKNILLSRINSAISNKEECISYFKDHLSYVNNIRVSIIEVNDEKLMKDLSKIIK